MRDMCNIQRRAGADAIADGRRMDVFLINQSVSLTRHAATKQTRSLVHGVTAGPLLFNLSSLLSPLSLSPCRVMNARHIVVTLLANISDRSASGQCTAAGEDRKDKQSVNLTLI